MTAIPVNTLSMEDLTAWETAKHELKAAQDREMLLRKKIVGVLFPSPKEGTNSYTLPNGDVVKAVCPLNRKPDVALISAMANDLRATGINLETVFKWKPELATTEYRKLTAEQMKALDACLEISPGSPQLSIVRKTEE